MSQEEPEAEDVKEDEEEPRWLQTVPIQILIVAIVTSMLSMVGERYKSTKQYSLAMLNQIESQDLWSLYNAKELKTELGLLREEALLTRQLQGSAGEELGGYLDYSETRNRRKMEQLAQEKELLFTRAREAQAARDHHLTQAQSNILMSRRLSSAIFFLQVSIMFLSVASLVKKITYYHTGNAVIAVALAMLYHAFFPFLPFFVE